MTKYLKKDYTKINLRKATVFDITDDPKILFGEFGLEDVDREEYSKYIAVEKRIMDFLALADLFNDVKLRNAVFEQFKDEFEIFGFE